MSLLDSIPVLTEEDFENPKLQVEDLVFLHDSLTLDNPMTYKIFLGKRDDLPEDEKEYYLEVIRRLQNNEQLRYKHAMKRMNDANFLTEKPEENNKIQEQ
jgi:hypothetical protein